MKIFDLSEETKKRYHKVKAEMTAKLKNKHCKINSFGKQKYYRRKYNNDVFVIVGYKPSEFSFFRCGYLDSFYVLKSVNRKYKTEVSTDYVDIINAP